MCPHGLQQNIQSTEGDSWGCATMWSTMGLPDPEQHHLQHRQVGQPPWAEPGRREESPKPRLNPVLLHVV